MAGTGFSSSSNSAPAFSFSTLSSLFTATSSASNPSPFVPFCSGAASASSFAFKPLSTDPFTTYSTYFTASSSAASTPISFTSTSYFHSTAAAAAASASASSTHFPIGTSFSSFSPVEAPPPFGTTASAFSTTTVSFSTPESRSFPFFATPAAASSSVETSGSISAALPVFSVSSSAATTTAAPLQFGATSASSVLTPASTAAQFSFSRAISSSSAQTSSSTAAVAGKTGGDNEDSNYDAKKEVDDASEETVSDAASGAKCGNVQAYDGYGGARYGSEAMPFQPMQRDKTCPEGDPASVEEWRTLIEAISTLALEGGNDVQERVTKRSGRHFDLFSPMVDLSLRCQAFCNQYQEERQMRENLDARILEQSHEMHMLRNKIEQLQMEATERERMPPLGDWWGIWQREVRRADEEKQRADEERQQVKELMTQLREVERKLGYYRSKYDSLSSQGIAMRGESSGSQMNIYWNMHRTSESEGRD